MVSRSRACASARTASGRPRSFHRVGNAGLHTLMVDNHPLELYVRAGAETAWR